MTLGDAPRDSVAVGDAVTVEVGVGEGDTDGEAPTDSVGVGVPDFELEREWLSVPELEAEVEGVTDAEEPGELEGEEVRELEGVAVSVGVEEAEAELESVLEGLDATHASNAATLLHAFAPHTYASSYTAA